jgi:hypothetical protein
MREMLIIDYNEKSYSLLQNKKINLSTEMPHAYTNLSCKGIGTAVWHLLSLMSSKF